MYELIPAGTNTYYIESPSKIGVYVYNGSDVCLIDSGNDKDAGKKILKILAAQGWHLRSIYNTHSNADHIGGNAFLCERTGCNVFSSEVEGQFTRLPLLESSFLYGGYPCKELRNKFLLAQPSVSRVPAAADFPPGFEPFALPGHFFGMQGVKTADGVCFLADSVFGENIVGKYHLFFIYDVRAYLQTLDFLDSLQGALFVPSHAPATTDIKLLTQINRAKIQEVCAWLVQACGEGIMFEDLLKKTFDFYGLTLDFNQYVLIGSTIKSYLSYLYDEGILQVRFDQNRLLWQAVKP